MLDTGLLTPEEVDQIHEAQAASQVLRLDSLYADIALRLGVASRADLDAAFAIQRERRFQIRVGELLVDRGAISSAQHRQVLMELLQSVRSEEKEYMRQIRLKKKLAPGAAPQLSEAERIRLAVTEPGGTRASEPAGAVAPATPPVRPAPAAPEPPPPAPVRIDSEDLESVEVEVAPPRSREAEAPRPPALPALGESVQEWLGSSSTDAPLDAAPPPRPKSGEPPEERPRRAAPSSEDELPESFFASNVIAVREEARAPRPENGSGRGPAARPSRPAAPARRGAAGARPAAPNAGTPKGPPARRGSLASFLESAIELIDEAPPPEVAATPGLLGEGLQAADLEAVQGDLAEADELVKSGLRTFRQLGRRQSDGARAPAFSADEYLRRRRRRALQAKLAVAAVVAFVVVPFGAGIAIAHRNRAAVEEARRALALGDFDAASAAAAKAGTFWIGSERLEDLRDEIELRRALAPVRTAEEAGDHARALEELKAVRPRFPRFLVETGELERALSYARGLARGEAAEEAGDLRAAVAAYQEAEQALAREGPAATGRESGRLASGLAPRVDEQRAAARVAAIRAALEKDIAAADGSGDIERQIAAYRRYRDVFGGKEDEIERKILEYDYRKGLEEGDAAADRLEFERALGHFYKASDAARKLGRPREIADIESRIRSAQKLENFQRSFNRAEELQRASRYDEAIQEYRRAAIWLGTPPGAVAASPRPPGAPPPARLPGLASPPPAGESGAGAGEREAGRLALLRSRIEECEKRRARSDAEAERARLWKEATGALRASRIGEAVAALEALEKSGRGDERSAKALAFARSLGDAVYVAAGESVIGSDGPGAKPEETPARRVAFAAFFIDRYEVRNCEYEAFLDAEGGTPPEHWQVPRDGPRGKTRTFAPEHASHPVVNVSFFEAAAYAKWRGKRLPTEEEWERAARGGDGRIWPWGSKTEGIRANVGARVSERVAIGTKPVRTSPDDVSPFGCYDMGGNASEWTASSFRPYPGNAAKGIDWSTEQKVLRGGSWRYEWDWARCAKRDRSAPNKRYPDTGFRCACDVPDFLPELK
jgi:formylglycine-generating enzyme required for sulfatase activity